MCGGWTTFVTYDLQLSALGWGMHSLDKCLENWHQHCEHMHALLSANVMHSIQLAICEQHVSMRPMGACDIQNPKCCLACAILSQAIA